VPAPKWFSSTSTRPRSTPVDPGRPWSGRPKATSLTSQRHRCATLGPVQPIQRSPPETLRGVLQREARVDDLGRLYARCLHTWPRTSGSRRAIGPCRGARRRSFASGDAGAPWTRSGAMEGAPRTKLMGCQPQPLLHLRRSGSDAPETKRADPARHEGHRSTSWVGPDDIDVVGATPLDMKRRTLPTQPRAVRPQAVSRPTTSIRRRCVRPALLEGNISRAPSPTVAAGLRVVSACGRTRRSGCTRRVPGRASSRSAAIVRHTAHTWPMSRARGAAGPHRVRQRGACIVVRLASWARSHAMGGPSGSCSSSRLASRAVEHHAVEFNPPVRSRAALRPSRLRGAAPGSVRRRRTVRGGRRDAGTAVMCSDRPGELRSPILERPDRFLRLASSYSSARVGLDPSVRSRWPPLRPACRAQFVLDVGRLASVRFQSGARCLLYVRLCVALGGTFHAHLSPSSWPCPGRARTTTIVPENEMAETGVDRAVVRTGTAPRRAWRLKEAVGARAVSSRTPTME